MNIPKIHICIQGGERIYVALNQKKWMADHFENFK